MRFILGILALAFSAAAFGQASEVARPDAKVEQRLKDLAEELRCLVCQNQTIADSSAPLAVDLRNQIRDQVRQGRSDGQIRDYMVERYGDFVLYRPPLKASTLALWAGPPVLILVGCAIFLSVVRRRRAATQSDPVTPQRRAELEALLRGEPAPSPTAPRRKKGGSR